MKLTLSLVILAGRDKTNLNRLLLSIKESSSLPHELIIVFDIKHYGEQIDNQTVEGCTQINIPYYGNGQLPHMRNIAINHAKGEYIWFVDDDVTFEKNTVEQLLITLNDIKEFKNIGAIVGRIIEDKPEWSVKKTKKPIHWSPIRGAIGFFNFDNNNFPFNLYSCLKSINEQKYPIIPFVQGTNMVFNKDRLIEVGGFDEDLGIGYSSFEDADLSFALKREGYITIFSGNFSLVHHKLFRVGGGTRGYKNDPYTISLIRNYIITSLKNSYPSKVFSIYFIIVYSLTFIPRLIYYNNGNSISLRTFSNIIHSFSVVLKGLFQGFKTFLITGYRRVNTSF